MEVQLRRAHRLGSAGSRGISRVGGQCWPCRWRFTCGAHSRLQGRSRQRNCGLRQHFRLPQSQTVQCLPVSWVPFRLPPQGWSAEQVSPSTPVCCRPFKRNALDSRSPCLSVPPSPLVFPGRTCGDFSAPEPWAGRPGLGWDPWPWEVRTATAETFHQLSAATRGCGPVRSQSPPSSRSWRDCFCPALPDRCSMAAALWFRCDFDVGVGGVRNTFTDTCVWTGRGSLV